MTREAMNYTIKITALIGCMLFMVSCNIIAGEEDREIQQPLTPPMPSSFPFENFAEGKPAVNFSAKGGFYLWKTGNSWHVRIAKRSDWFQVSPARPIVISGSIIVENALTIDVRPHNIMTPPDRVSLEIDDIFFNFELGENNVEGFNFKLHPKGFEYCVTVDVRFNGEPAPDIIILGRAMYSPNTLPLRLCVRS